MLCTISLFHYLLTEYVDWPVVGHTTVSATVISYCPCSWSPVELLVCARWLMEETCALILLIIYPSRHADYLATCYLHIISMCPSHVSATETFRRCRICHLSVCMLSFSLIHSAILFRQFVSVRSNSTEDAS